MEIMVLALSQFIFLWYFLCRITIKYYDYDCKILCWRIQKIKGWRRANKLWKVWDGMVSPQKEKSLDNLSSLNKEIRNRNRDTLVKWRFKCSMNSVQVPWIWIFFLVWSLLVKWSPAVAFFFYLLAVYLMR